MSPRGYLAIVVGTLLCAVTMQAQDSGNSDTLRYRCHNVFEPGTDSFGVPIYVYNDDSLSAISLVYCFESSNARFSSASPGERLAAASPSALSVSNRPDEKAFVLSWIGSQIHPILPAAESWRFATVWFRTYTHWPCPEDLWLDTCTVAPGFATGFSPLQGDEFAPYIWHWTWQGQCPLIVCMDVDEDWLSPDDPAVQLRVGLHPNPFNSRTVLEVSTVRSGSIVIEIYDILGRRVRRLVDGEFAAGDHAFAWDGNDDDGRQATSGVYFARITERDTSATRKVVLLR